MTEERRPTVVDMLRTTANNTAEFMDKVAAHIETLEQELIRLRQRVQEMEMEMRDAKPE
jgi:predicted metalloprotease with PDZ domain